MPIYEYACSKCGHEFEVLIRSQKDHPDQCPKCGAKKPAKSLSAFAVASAAHKAAEAATCPTCPSAARGGCGGACPLS